MAGTRKAVFPGHKTRKLTAKQAAFVREYIIDHNATQAAIRAGYGEKYASDIGAQLLKKNLIARAIADKEDHHTEHLSLTAEQTLNELAIIAFSSPDHYVLKSDGRLGIANGAPGHAMQAVKVRHKIHRDGNKVIFHETEYTLWDKNTALTNLAKHFRLLIDRFELTTPMIEEVQRLAAEHGLTPEEILAEAQTLVSGKGSLKLVVGGQG